MGSGIRDRQGDNVKPTSSLLVALSSSYDTCSLLLALEWGETNKTAVSR